MKWPVLWGITQEMRPVLQEVMQEVRPVHRGVMQAMRPVRQVIPQEIRGHLRGAQPVPQQRLSPVRLREP